MVRLTSAPTLVHVPILSGNAPQPITGELGSVAVENHANKGCLVHLYALTTFEVGQEPAEVGIPPLNKQCEVSLRHWKRREGLLQQALLRQTAAAGLLIGGQLRLRMWEATPRTLLALQPVQRWNGARRIMSIGRHGIHAHPGTPNTSYRLDGTM